MSDLTIEILKQIRDGVAAVAERVERTNAGLAELRHDTNARFAEVRADLKSVDVRLERVELGLRDLGGFMREIAREQAEQREWHRHHVQVLERDMTDVKARLVKLETGQ
jgi:hypothetical protein